VGESARYSNGALIDLEKVPLKYAGLDQWEIWVSESQERMTVAVAPEDLEAFMALSRRHAVESTVIGRYTDTGELHIRYENKTCACVDLSLLESGFPQWTFEAFWQPPQNRGLNEPVISEPSDYAALVLAMLERPNICAKNWIARQYDHEVQGTSTIKPLIGAGRDVPSDAAVIRPVLTAERGLAFAQALIPQYSAIDAFHMTGCTIDEAVRRIVAVGGNPAHIGGVDNFCWPSIQYDPEKNPDGRFKAAQLVRACQALRDFCLAYEIPLLSGKDSMYVDGHLPGRFGERHKVSALETLQFSAVSVIDDITCCVTMDLKAPGDTVYVLGQTRNELGASEYYDLFGQIGCQVPKADPQQFLPLYHCLARAINAGLVASAHGIYRGGLGVHLPLVAVAGRLGLAVDLDKVPTDGTLRADQVLFSESAGRFVVSVDPTCRVAFENLFTGLPLAAVGTVTADPVVQIGVGPRQLLEIPVDRLVEAWKRPFGDLV
jgi:phosphoribosylformylglycinamidine synthase